MYSRIPVHLRDIIVPNSLAQPSSPQRPPSPFPSDARRVRFSERNERNTRRRSGGPGNGHSLVVPPSTSTGTRSSRRFTPVHPFKSPSLDQGPSLPTLSQPPLFAPSYPTTWPGIGQPLYSPYWQATPPPYSQGIPQRPPPTPLWTPGQVPQPPEAVPSATQLPWPDIFTIFSNILKQIYFSFLLHLPLLYHSRIARVMADASISEDDIIKMWSTSPIRWIDGKSTRLATMSTDSATQEKIKISDELAHFKGSWNGFIDDLLREWTTSNTISVLLMSAILTLLQIETAGADPFIRTAAVLSFIAATLSLLYGCISLIRFGSMRKMHRAAQWAFNAAHAAHFFLWNVWVMIAMPAVWLAWSLIFFLVSIMAFVWRTNSSSFAANNDGPTTSRNIILGNRIAVTAVLGIGLLYLAAMISTFSQYGDSMDKAWQDRVDKWEREQTMQVSIPQAPHPSVPNPGPNSRAPPRPPPPPPLPSWGGPTFPPPPGTSWGYAPPPTGPTYPSSYSWGQPYPPPPTFVPTYPPPQPPVSSPFIPTYSPPSTLVTPPTYPPPQPQVFTPFTAAYSPPSTPVTPPSYPPPGPSYSSHWSSTPRVWIPPQPPQFESPSHQQHREDTSDMSPSSTSVIPHPQERQDSVQTQGELPPETYSHPYQPNQVLAPEEARDSDAANMSSGLQLIFDPPPPTQQSEHQVGSQQASPNQTPPRRQPSLTVESETSDEGG